MVVRAGLRSVAALMLSAFAVIALIWPSSASPVVAHEWLLDANDTGTGTPASTFQASMAYDTALGTAMYVANIGFTSPSNPGIHDAAVVQISTGHGWGGIAFAPSGELHCCFDVAYDPVHSVIVGVGTCFGSPDECTWTWNGGSTWTQVSSTGLGQLTDEAGLAYDASLGGVVLLGTTDHGRTSVTYLWNGSAWTTLGSGPALWPLCAHPDMPCAPEGQSLAYDAARAQLLFFGGSSGAETWALRGTSWVRLPTRSHPGAGGPMAYDAVGQTIVMVGSLTGVRLPPVSSTYTWDGAWHAQVSALPTTVAGAIQAVTFDSSRHAVIGASAGDPTGASNTGSGTVVYTALP